jgi:dihydroorotase
MGVSYDVLLKGGTVVDPAQGLHALRDVAVTDGKIATLEEEIPAGEAKRVIEAQGMLVTPGLIDLHTHVAEAIMPIALTPDEAGVRSGVTAVCDAGSVGYATFNAFKQLIIRSAHTDVFCFLHVCPTGQAVSPEICWEGVDPQRMLQLIEAEREIIKGIKIRANGHVVAHPDLEMLRLAKTVAVQAGLPLMVHIGLSSEEQVSDEVLRAFNRQMLALLDPGDILTHPYTQRRGGVIQPDGGIPLKLRAAAERGVVLDVAPAKSHFSFELARIALEQGLFPTTLSTDITCTNYQGPALFSLPVVMSKFLALGLSIDDVVAKATLAPARILGEGHRRGSLKPGFAADVTVLEQLQGEFLFSDGVAGHTLMGDQLLEPRLTLKDGVEFEASSRFRDHVPGEPIPLTRGA